MPLVPTTKGNRVKYAAAGENTAVEPISVTENPNNPAAPQGGVGNQPAYIPYYGANISPQLAGRLTSPTTASSGGASTITGNFPYRTYDPYQDYTSWAEYTPLPGRVDTRGYTPLASQSHNKTVVTATPHVWVVQREPTAWDEMGNEIAWGDSYAIMPDGTAVPLAYAEMNADFYDSKYGAGAAKEKDTNEYVADYNKNYELSEVLHPGWKPEQHNAWVLRKIGLDDETLFGGGSGGGGGISPLAAWQLQSQNWREALPYQVNAGAANPPGWESGGIMNAIFNQAGVPYNPEVYRTIVSNAPGMPGGGGGGTTLPPWLTQQAPQEQAQFTPPILPDIELFKPEQVTNWMGNATQWR